MTVTIDARLAADPAAVLKLGRALIDHGDAAKAIALVEQAMRERPDDRLLSEAAAMLFTQEVPRYHLAMLADTARNAAYASAIERAAPGRRMLEIGAGSGLLAMLAAQAGAREVVACEANATLAVTAEKIIAANGLADKVRLIPRHSASLDPESDLGGPVDLIATETFGHDLLGENVLPSLCDALSRLALPACRVIPAGAAVRVALARLKRPLPSIPDIICGLDLGLFGRHAPSYYRIDVGDPALQLRSEPVDLFKFDLADVATMAGRQARVSACTYGGRVDGVVQWLRLELDDQSAYENLPGDGASSHWQALYWPMDVALESAAGDLVAIHGWHDQTQTRVWVEKAR
ncbi:MAG TPA: hypothetical protein VNA29_09330 [Sphingomicrobium sp.]|nr:hypothetical protein [Sphingomicrobium sp.]